MLIALAIYRPGVHRGNDRQPIRSVFFARDDLLWRHIKFLQRRIQALRPRQGIGLLNEADVYNEIDLASGDAVLVEHFIDVYVRRAALAIAFALEQLPSDRSLAQRWSVILEKWCLAELDNAFFSREKRDVYELDVPHWLHLLEQAGAKVLSHHYTDEWNLFHQYIFTPHEEG